LNAFDDARTVELAGKDDLIQFLDNQACNSRVVITDKGPLAKFLQETVGDAIMNDRQMLTWGVEFKIEQRHTGNLFLETWSNLNRRNPGWMLKLNTDILLYYFLDAGVLYSIGFQRLVKWAFGDSDKFQNGERVQRRSPGRIYEFPEKRQGKRDQLNDTWGRLVPVAVLKNEVGIKEYRRVEDGFERVVQ
jgi:hypothetical protein